MRWPLRTQILLPLLAVSIASVAVIGGVNTWLAYAAARDASAERLRGVATVLAESSFPLTHAVLTQMRDLSGVHLVLTTADGSARSTSLPAARALPVAGAADSPGQMTLARTVAIDGARYLHGATRLNTRAGRPTGDILHVLLPVAAQRRALWSAAGPPLVVGGLSLAAVVAAAHAIARRIGQTTERIGAEVQRLVDGDYRPVSAPPHDDELADLCRAVNQAATRLESYEQGVREAERAKTLAALAAGLAHEMRNAATGCRMAIDLHAEACPLTGDDSLGVARRQLQTIESQLQRYLRLGAPDLPRDAQPLEPDLIVAEAVDQARPAAAHAGATLEWTPGAAGVTLKADAEALRQVIANLLQNALEAVAAGRAADARRGLVRLTADARQGCWRLTVCDNGDGPPEGVRRALFEPFVTSKPEGVGLGLALSRQAAEQHGGRIDWRREQGVTRFTLALPITDTEREHG